MANGFGNASLSRSVLGALAVVVSSCAALAQPLELPGAQFNLPPLSVPSTPQLAPTQPAAPEAPAAPAPIAPASPTAPAAPAPPAVGVATPPVPGPTADLTALTLRRNAAEGSLALTRTPAGLAAAVTFDGRGIANADEACAVTIAGEGDAAGVALEPVQPLGRYMRWRLVAPACPVVFTMFEDAVLASHGGLCTFEAADCRVDPSGVWAPEPEALPTDPERIARALAEADEDVRAAFRTLTERSEGDALRSVLAEQAGFSADRVTTCARFAGGDAVGQCAARWTQARAAELQSRLGSLPAAAPAAPTAAAPGAGSAPLSILPESGTPLRP